MLLLLLLQDLALGESLRGELRYVRRLSLLRQVLNVTSGGLRLRVVRLLALHSVWRYLLKDRLPGLIEKESAILMLR